MTNDNEQIDALIMDAASADFAKIAVVISKTFDAYEKQGGAASKTLSKEIAEALYVLIDNGALVCEGNMRRWREAQVKLA